MPPPIHKGDTPTNPLKPGTRRAEAKKSNRGGWFRCKVGVCAMGDTSAEKDDNGQYPIKQFSTGERFYSDRDLVALNPAKFERTNAPKGYNEQGVRVMGADPGNPTKSTFTFPAGQVPEGFQETGGAYEGDDGVPSGHDEDLEDEAHTEVDHGHVFRTTTGDEKSDISERDTGSTEDSDAEVNGDEEPDYDAMTVADLKAHAEEEEIDLHGKTLKPDIIRTIRAAGRKKAKGGK